MLHVNDAMLHVNDAMLHVDDTGVPPGHPDAPTVLFGHGLLFSGRMFAPQVARLRDRYRCVTIDWRGQGKSPAAPGAADMDTLTADALAVIQHLGLGAVHYVGLSMGGFVGMRLAARHPEVIASLTLLDTSAGPEDPDKVASYRLLAKVYGVLGIRPVRSRVEPLMFGPTFLADPASVPHRQAWITELSAARRSGMKKAIYGVTDREPVLAELDRITAPTLVVVGADDAATPVAKAEVVARGIREARLEVVPDAGHSSTIEQPTALSDLIEGFLAEHQPGATPRS